MKIFLTGASGYIGGNVAAALLAAGHRVAGLVRSEERAAQVRALGVEPVLGTLSDATVLAQAARGGRGSQRRQCRRSRRSGSPVGAIEGSGKAFIQTSGSGIVADAAGGAVTTAIYEDESPVHPLPVRAARVALNATVLSAAARGVRAVVIAPTMIYGRGDGCQSEQHPSPADDRGREKSGRGALHRRRRERLVECSYRRPRRPVSARAGHRACWSLLLCRERREFDARDRGRERGAYVENVQ